MVGTGGSRVVVEGAAAVKTFVSPGTTLGALDPISAATLIGAASDITLVLDPDGTVRDLVVRSDDLAGDLDDNPSWIGQKLTSLVQYDSRSKVAILIREATTDATTRWRHLNHMTAAGRPVPVLYCGVQMNGGRVVLFGRDLRAMSELQQRLVNVQQSLERDYSRMREVETRYRLLFQMSSEAVLIFDAEKGRVTEANPAASQLLGADIEEIAGQQLTTIFEAGSQAPVQTYLAAIRAGSREADLSVKLAPQGRAKQGLPVQLRASTFRQASATLYLLRLAASANAVPTLPDVKSKLLAAVEAAPDGFLVTDDAGNILTANAAFLEMAQLANESLAIGQPVDRWIGQTGVDMDVLVNNVRQRGTVRFFSTVMRGEDGGSVQVEISAVSVRSGGQPCFGYAVRNVGPRVQVAPRAAKQLPRSVEQLTELIGRVALKDLVREATEVIERLSIEAALELTGDNRASAAEMLGLSRQSLYVKLRRYGLGDLSGVDRE